MCFRPSQLWKHIRVFSHTLVRRHSLSSFQHVCFHSDPNSAPLAECHVSMTTDRKIQPGQPKSRLCESSPKQMLGSIAPRFARGVDGIFSHPLTASFHLFYSTEFGTRRRRTLPVAQSHPGSASASASVLLQSHRASGRKKDAPAQPGSDPQTAAPNQ